MFVSAITDPETGKQLEYQDLVQDIQYKAVWEKALTKELDQLAQGQCGYAATNTISFIQKEAMLVGRKAAYGRIVCNYRPQKEDPSHVRLMVGGDQVEYLFDVSTPTADLVTVKLLMNSVISTEGAKFLTIDIKNFYLNTPMERYAYIRLQYEILLQEFVTTYNLDELKTKDG
eukprot:15364621-Ditylum_brightwellii.AAC.2